MSIKDSDALLNRSRRMVILSAVFALLPIRAFAQDVKFGVAPPLENIPYVLGGFLFTYPIKPDHVVLPLQDKVDAMQKVP